MKLNEQNQYRLVFLNKNIQGYLKLLENKDFSLISESNLIRLIQEDTQNLFSLVSELVPDFIYNEINKHKSISNVESKKTEE